MISLKTDRRAQSVIEYILLVTAVMVVVISLTVKNSFFAGKVNEIVNAPVQMIQAANKTVTFQNAN